MKKVYECTLNNLVDDFNKVIACLPMEYKAIVKNYQNTQISKP